MKELPTMPNKSDTKILQVLRGYARKGLPRRQSCRGTSPRTARGQGCAANPHIHLGVLKLPPADTIGQVQQPVLTMGNRASLTCRSTPM